MENLIEEMEPIYSYTRAQAIEDGVLFDVSEVAKEAGFLLPTAITEAVWNELNDIPKNRKWESFEGRLWDCLNMAGWQMRAIKSLPDDHPLKNASSITYEFILTFPKEKKQVPGFKNRCINKIVLGPGDHGEPVITIMKPYED